MYLGIFDFLLIADRYLNYLDTQLCVYIYTHIYRNKLQLKSDISNITCKSKSYIYLTLNRLLNHFFREHTLLKDKWSPNFYHNRPLQNLVFTSLNQMLINKGTCWLQIPMRFYISCENM